MWLLGDHGRLIKWHQPDNFAFVERSRTMKAPVGLLSDRTVLRSKMEGLCPDKFRVVELSRVYHTIPQSASKTKRTTDQSRWFLSSGGGWSIQNFTSQAPASFRSALVGRACSKPCQERVRQTGSYNIDQLSIACFASKNSTGVTKGYVKFSGRSSKAFTVLISLSGRVPNS